MMIDLEDNASDIVSKAQRGLGISDSELAQKSGASIDAIRQTRGGDFDETQENESQIGIIYPGYTTMMQISGTELKARLVVFAKERVSFESATSFLRSSGTGCARHPSVACGALKHRTVGFKTD